MNRVVPVVSTAAVTLERFDHPAGEPHTDPERERAEGHAINFVEAGSFSVRTTGRWQAVGGDSLFVTRPGLEFSCTHHHDRPDDRCLSLSLSDRIIESAPACTRLPGDAVRTMSNRQAYIKHCLQDSGRGDEARVEALALALIASLGTPTGASFRADRLSWYAARVDRAKALIADRYAEPLSLSILARDAGMSLFHFARIFAELEGCTPHRYLREVRLTAARERLRAGASVTDTCLASGFGSLSHFVNAYKQRFGHSPSRRPRLGR